MIHKKLFMAFVFAGALCLALPAGAQNGAPQKRIDPAALAEAIKNCPGLTGADAAALAVAAQNCPGLNGTIKGTNCPDLTGPIDPVALARAAQNCPALNPSLPPEARNCPALNGDLAAAVQNCPAFGGGGFIGPVAGMAGSGNVDKKIDKRMRRIVKALERNKNSAELLIQAARDAGADPNAIADLEKMSAAFRQVFMSTVSPQQIIEGLLSRQAAPVQEEPQGIIIQSPDGSTWLVAPADQNPQPVPPPSGMPPKGKPGMEGPQGIPPAAGKPMPPQGMVPQFMPPQGMPPAVGQPMPPQGMSPQFMPPQQGMQPQFMPPQGMAPQGKPSAIGRPPKAPGQGMPPAFNAPSQQPMPQGQMIIMEEEEVVPQYMPLWPTKDDLGKGGVLQYLEKRNQRMNAN